MPAAEQTSPEHAVVPVAFSTELLRVGVILLAAGVLGLATNALSDKPVPLLSKNGPGAPPQRARRMSAETLKKSFEAGRPIIILDVRSADKFAAGHAQNARNAPAAEFIDYYGRLNLSTLLLAAEDVVLLCEGDLCPSADRVAKQLNELGHKNVHVLQDGWEAYRAAGLPVEGSAR
ncbi:MAG TPA: rhodanese-like domain-containing protein [Planctomycetota bacterium]|nr:rhodanese-like domain-containing protein [Planctomycetota bacterium]